LVIGFLQPSAGNILLDGHDLQTLDLRSYRRHISVVSQETLLFDGSVRDNICYGLNDVSEATIEQALRDANALEFVLDEP